MTPAEQLVMAIDSPILDGLDAAERIAIAIEAMGDKRYGSLSSGERAVMRIAAHLDAVSIDVVRVDDVWRERIGDALGLSAAVAWKASDSAALGHRYLINEDGAS